MCLFSDMYEKSLVIGNRHKKKSRNFQENKTGKSGISKEFYFPKLVDTRRWMKKFKSYKKPFIKLNMLCVNETR